MTDRDRFMKTIELPPKIKMLMEQGLWKAKENCLLEQELRKHNGWSDPIMLFNNLEKHDEGLIITSEKEYTEFYGTYRTGNRVDKLSLDWIDANKSIMIGWNYDEDSICLDYRFSIESPRILASYSSMPRINTRWKEVATDEDELIFKLGIEI